MKREILSDEELADRILTYKSAIAQVKARGYVLEGSTYEQQDMLDYSSSCAYYDVDSKSLEYGEHYYNGGYAYPLPVYFNIEYLETMLKHYMDLKIKRDLIKQKKEARLEKLRQLSSHLHLKTNKSSEKNKNILKLR